MRKIFFILCFAFALSGVGEAQVKTEIISGLYTATGVFCGSGITQALIRGKENPPILADSTKDYCLGLFHKADDYELAGRDSASHFAFRDYIEQCAMQKDAFYSFVDLGKTNADRTEDNSRFEEYREWLKKVLYYNPDTNYYCADVGQMLSTFSWFNNTRGRDHRGALAVAYFLVQENKCPGSTAYYDTIGIPQTWHSLYDIWQDTVKDDHAVFDSTLPSLEDLGLGILRGNPADVKRFNDAVMGPVMSNLHALENPFTSETTIGFTCREAVLLRFEVYDVLGKKVFDAGEHLYTKGDNTLRLSGTDLPNGILYGRFSTRDGSIKTIMLRHY